MFRKRLNLVVCLAAIFSLVLFHSCQKEPLEAMEKLESDEMQNRQNATSGNQGPAPGDGMVRLGKKLNDPYTVANMQLAYDNLARNDRNLDPNLILEKTHLHVRFLPADDDEYEILLGERDMELYTYPYDYEVLEDGVYYHDPSIPEKSITWHYTVVKADYKFSTIRYEILNDLFIPEELDGTEQNGKYLVLINERMIEPLVDEVLRITGNEDDGPKSVKMPPKWTPKGYIKVFDHIVNGFTPVQGALVRARRWATTKTGYTNASGYFQTGQFRRKVNYSVKWERGYYQIRQGYFPAAAFYNGPKKKGDWNLNIGGANDTGKNMRFATIHRAAHRYHYKNIGGMKRPNAWTQLKISSLSGVGTGVYWGNLVGIFGVIPNIKIWSKSSSNTYYPTHQLFSTTIHELGHASHLELMNAGEIQMIQVQTFIIESWANAVEWFITQIEYNELGFPNYDVPNETNAANDIDNSQQWRISTGNSDYTSLFIDLVDHFNQAVHRGNQPADADRCPDGGWYDGANCQIGSPPAGESAFIYDDNFYYTPVGCCDCPMPGTWWDTVNCFVQDVPPNSIPFIWSNNWYLHPAGDPDFPFDTVKGYTLEGIEDHVLKHSYGMSSLTTKLKANKPSGMTDKRLDKLLAAF